MKEKTSCKNQFYHLKYIKSTTSARHGGVLPVIPAIWEGLRQEVQVQPGQLNKDLGCQGR